MGVPEFYLNALSQSRLDVFEFLLSLKQYVQEKDRGMVQSNSALPARVHPGLSPDIGDIVHHYVKKFRGIPDFMSEIKDMVNNLLNEQFSGVSRLRDHVLRMANVYVLSQKKETECPALDTTCRSDLDYRNYLLNFITKLSEAKKLQNTYMANLRYSVSSPAIIKVGRYLESYAQFSGKKNSKSWLKFLARVCTLLSEVAHSEAKDNVFQVLGEVENVICKYNSTFPGYKRLDETAKKEKSVIFANNQATPN